MIKRTVGRAVLHATRWGSAGSPPDIPKYVMIGAPHTSNWDLLFLLMFAWSHGLSVSWLGKDSLFVGPVGWLLRGLGGIPVRRGQRGGLVDSLAATFAAAPELIVVVPPEGTRRRTDHWKSGFYRVAGRAGVPVVCSYLDYGTRVGGFGPTVWPSADEDADMEVFRAFYAGKQGKYADQFSEVRLRDTPQDRT